MKRFLTSSVNYPKKKNDNISSSNATVIPNNEIIEDPISATTPTTTDIIKIDQKKNTTDVGILFSNHYLFDGQFYKVLQVYEKRLTVKCQTCSKTIQGQINSTGNFLSHIKVSTYYLTYLLMYYV